MPSKTALSRSLEAYFHGPSQFFPFIHAATFTIREKPAELLLGIAAVGHLYEMEHSQAYEMYVMAKAILMEKLRCDSLSISSNVLGGHPSIAISKNGIGQRIQTLNLLLHVACWSKKDSLSDAPWLGGLLVNLVRQHGTEHENPVTSDDGWSSWVAAEERRRTIMAAYSILNLQSIAFNTPPLLLSQEMEVYLPCTSTEWNSTDHVQWSQNKTSSNGTVLFREALRALFTGSDDLQSRDYSSLASYLLIHGILQRVVILRLGCQRLLQPGDFKTCEKALCAWQSLWDTSNETTLEPTALNGALGLSSMALLRLAYVRLNSDTGPYRGLLNRDPQRVLHKLPDFARSTHADRAALQAVDALSMLVRQGREPTACSKGRFWSIEQSLSSLECAMLLREWFDMMATSIRICGTIRKSEIKLINAVMELLEELGLTDALRGIEDEELRIQHMSAVVASLLADVYKGPFVLEIDECIERSLTLLAETSQG